jgi:hypothetical protein
MPRYTSKNNWVIADVTVDPTAINYLLRNTGHNMSQAGIAVFLETEIAPWVQRRVARRFAGEGDDVTGAWAPLAPATEAIRAARGFPPSHPINQRTHMMRDWLVANDGEIKIGGADVTLTYPGPTNDGLMDTKIKAAQMGKTYPQTPPRPILGLNDTDDLFIQSALVQFLLSGL